jgi:hypothetical protein
MISAIKRRVMPKDFVGITSTLMAAFIHAMNNSSADINFGPERGSLELEGTRSPQAARPR